MEIIVRCDFNSRPRERGDRRQNHKQRTVSISIHAPARGATRIIKESICTSEFQFTPLREGRLHAYVCRFQDCLFQFTPLREGRLLTMIDLKIGEISIHAPARGATGNRTRKKNTGKISIHAPARGATKILQKFESIRNISIHAPARGATYVRSQRNDRQNISIHAPARGATRYRIAAKTDASKFQFTPLREGRLPPPMACAISAHISIHAPARGATRPHERAPTVRSDFNSRPCERGDFLK